MSTIEKCLNTKCNKDGNATFDGYCSNKCKNFSKRPNVTPKDFAQKQADADAKALIHDTRLNTAPAAMTRQQLEAIEAKRISDIVNKSSNKGGRNSKRMRKNKKSRKSRRRNSKNKIIKY